MSSSAMSMRKLVFICIFLLVWANVAAAQSIITIEVNKSGNALWTLEKRIPLSKSELSQWEAAKKTGQNISIYREVSEFNDTVSMFAEASQKFTNRSMDVEDFNISNVTYDTIKTLSDGYGIIRYTFIWKNFSQTNSSLIYVGDAFPEKMPLSSEDVLILRIPEGYDVQNSTPTFDKREGNDLIWDRTLFRNFSKGEPSLVLSNTNVSALPANSTEKDSNYSIFYLMIITIIGIAAVSIAMVLFQKKKQSSDLVKPAEEISENEAEQSAENDVAMAQPPDLTEEFLGYEDMIEKLLAKSGGQSYQSDIVKQSGLSKSKISIVLAQMKEEGRILKIRKGKENIIRLIKKEENNQ